MSERESQHYATIVVVGGGCYGSYYVHQLQRAASAGALSAERVLVVDRDAACPAREIAPIEQLRVEFVASDWSEFFDGYLTAAANAPDSARADAIVPSPLMPHLMGEWLVKRARQRFGDAVTTRPFDRAPDVPWERAGADGTHYVSFATWTCPVNCIEPRICPHTRETRDWSMPTALARTGADVAVLHCVHRAYGVGMFDTMEVVRADEQIRTAPERGSAEVIIGTVSHCHGALTRLVLANAEPIGSANR